MLEQLTLENMGLAPKLTFEFGPRLNIITGDNGVGKTFVLDSAWFALTRTWAVDKIIIPPPQLGASISYQVHGKGGANRPVTCGFDRKEQRWKLPRKHPPMPGLIIYARVDGSFSVWDPARNYWQASIESDVVSESRRDQSRPDKFDFDSQSLWDGLWLPDRTTVLCRGLIEDWETWRLKGNGKFRLLEQVLDQLSPNEDERLLPGRSRKVSILDSREVPTLRLPYGEVPITQISAGMRRILSFAYVLVWAWTEHKRAVQLTGEAITQRVIILLDEVEAHLHPQWQRRLLPAVLDAVQNILLSNKEITIQVIATTHAPLVLASIETHFNAVIDKLFNLKLTEQRQVEVEEIPWAKQGDVISWLTSDMFDLATGYSTEAERAIRAADDFMAGLTDRLPPGLRTREAIEAELRRTLPGDDPYWANWIGANGPPASVTRA